MNTAPTSTPPTHPDRALYSIKEAAILLCVSVPTIAQMFRKRILESKKIGRRRLITKASIDKIIQEATDELPAKPRTFKR